MQEMFVKKHLRPKIGMKILDIGCGTADVLTILPKVQYVGFDINQRYIRTAKKNYRGGGVFLVRKIEQMNKAPYGPYDLVLAKGLIHHLPDAAALHLLQFAHDALRVGGRLVTLDGVLTPKQGFWARYFVSHDRGRHVRTLSAYRALFRHLFPKTAFFVYDDLLRFPYTLLVTESRKTIASAKKRKI
jgi:SAM-dependent methyltransferase